MIENCNTCPGYTLCEPEKKGYLSQKTAVKAACNENKKSD
jgi:hypothetical protein